MRPADLLAIAAPAARAKSVPIPSAGEADAFSRALDSQLRQSAVDDGHCGTTGSTATTEAATSPASANGTRPAASPVREGPHGQSFGVQAHLAQTEARAARAEWRDFLQGLRDAGLIGGVRTDVASGLTGKGMPTALVADPGTSTPKPAPESTTPFGQALDALGAAIQAAIADPAASPAQPGQLPPAVQSALDAAAALAPPALQARMQAFADRLANGLGAAMAAASGETPAPTTTKTAKGSNGADSPVAQAILAAVAGAGEGADLSALRALHEKVAPARGAASAPADASASAAATTTGAGTQPAADKPGAARVADATPAAQPSGAEAAATRLEDTVARNDLAAVTDNTQGRAELTSQATPAASAPAAETHVATLVATRGAPELVAQMAAVISRKLEGRITRFNMELNPAEMGRVDVRLSINSDGRVAAQMAFDNPAAAADMRGKADELRRQLEQSGFNVASEDLTFSDRQTGQGFQRQDQTPADPDIARARAFREADRNARLAEDAGRLSNRAILGLDMRV